MYTPIISYLLLSHESLVRVCMVHSHIFPKLWQRDGSEGHLGCKWVWLFITKDCHMDLLGNRASSVGGHQSIGSTVSGLC